MGDLSFANLGVVNYVIEDAINTGIVKGKDITPGDLNKYITALVTNGVPVMPAMQLIAPELTGKYANEIMQFYVRLKAIKRARENGEGDGHITLLMQLGLSEEMAKQVVAQIPISNQGY